VKILNEDKGTTFALILDKKEAMTLLEIVEAAQQANKRKSSFRSWRKNLEEQLCCF
jgi:hypothetical protein